MKFSALYANNDTVFPRIHFKSGFNVVFAQVKNPEIKETDSHNLGKTFLIEVIDFTLLSSVDKKHPFKVHDEIFDDFVFFLEIETIDNRYVTVKRPVSGRSGMSIHVHSVPDLDLREEPDSYWTHAQLSLTKAKELLDDLLNLQSIKPYPYRKGLGYFLRGQSDYEAIFRISNFQYGPDKNWKPFVALLLGFDPESTTRKYDIDDRIKSLENTLTVLEEEAGSRSDEYDEIRGLIEIRTESVNRLRAELDVFSFQNLEATISRTAVNDIEAQVSALNERRYIIDYELQEIERPLNSDLEFDIDKIQEIFREVSIVFPDSLVKSYEDLIEFNRQLTDGRSERLARLRQKLVAERENIVRQLEMLDSRRQSALEILKNQETLAKYRRLQSVLSGQEHELSGLQQRLMQLNQAANIENQIEEKRQESAEAVNSIRQLIRQPNQIFSQIRTTFSNYVERVLNVQALLSVSINQSGNLEFNARTLDKETAGRETSEALGTSYRKILATCFDLALLSVYADKNFYRFAYHDGVFEGLDNRKKVSLLDLIREVCEKFNIQHILTVIDSDLPRDERDQKLLFTNEDIIRHLHDQGNDGRLFRTQAF